MSKIFVFFEHLHRVINLDLYRHEPKSRPNFLFSLLTTRLNRAEPIYTETRSCFGDNYESPCKQLFGLNV